MSQVDVVPVNKELSVSQHRADPKPESEAHPPGDFAEAAEPFALFESWLHDAERHEPNDPTAMALATVDAAGEPNVRMVLLKGLDPAGRPDRWDHRGTSPRPRGYSRTRRAARSR